jgi:hypothetical protein
MARLIDRFSLSVSNEPAEVKEQKCPVKDGQERQVHLSKSLAMILDSRFCRVRMLAAAVQATWHLHVRARVDIVPSMF